MYVLHFSPDSASLVVRMVLEELSLPYELRLVDRAAGALDSPDYRALQPLGLIPALETPGGVIFETAAILLWLADRHPQPGLAPAPGDAGRGDFLKWFFYTSTNLHPTLLQVFYPHRLIGPEVADAVRTAARDRFASFLPPLEAAAAASPDWLTPARPSILGYYLGMLMRWMGSFPPDSGLRINPADYPALHRVLAALESRSAAQSVAQDEGLGPLPFTEST